jgi:hypothetical protein
MKIPSTKSQIPNKHQSPKYQYSNNRLPSMNIGILYCLENKMDKDYRPSSFLRKQESMPSELFWIPACAGMTTLRYWYESIFMFAGDEPVM